MRSPADTLASVAFPKSVFTREQVKHFDKEGSRIEVSPDSYAVAKSIADRIGESGGCGLVIDYGKDGVSADSLRVGSFLWLYQLFFKTYEKLTVLHSIGY